MAAPRGASGQARADRAGHTAPASASRRASRCSSHADRTRGLSKSEARRRMRRSRVRSAVTHRSSSASRFLRKLAASTKSYLEHTQRTRLSEKSAQSAVGVRALCEPLVIVTLGGIVRVTAEQPRVTVAPADAAAPPRGQRGVGRVEPLRLPAWGSNPRPQHTSQSGARRSSSGTEQGRAAVGSIPTGGAAVGSIPTGGASVGSIPTGAPRGRRRDSSSHRRL